MANQVWVACSLLAFMSYAMREGLHSWLVGLGIAGIAFQPVAANLCRIGLTYLVYLERCVREKRFVKWVLHTLPPLYAKDRPLLEEWLECLDSCADSRRCMELFLEVQQVEELRTWPFLKYARFYVRSRRQPS